MQPQINPIRIHVALITKDVTKQNKLQQTSEVNESESESFLIYLAKSKSYLACLMKTSRIWIDSFFPASLAFPCEWAGVMNGA